MGLLGRAVEGAGVVENNEQVARSSRIILLVLKNASRSLRTQETLMLDVLLCAVYLKYTVLTYRGPNITSQYSNDLICRAFAHPTN